MNNKLKTIITIPAVILISIGTVFYLGGRFEGLLFLLAGGLLLLGYSFFTSPRKEFLEKLKKRRSNIFIPFIGISVALIIGGIIMLLAGINPVKAYGALFYGGFVKNWHVSVLNATPLIFTGLSIAFAFKAGLFNIGAEGQFYIGSMAAVFFGIYLKLPPVISVLLIFLISCALAGLYNGIPALLKVKTGAHEVITTMMFAHIAKHSSSLFIRSMGGDPQNSTHPYVTDPILDSNWLLRFKDFMPGANYRLHIGILIALITAVFVYYLLYNTRWGFEIRAVGHNPHGAKNQGISISKNIYRALLVAGFLAGMAGVSQVLGLDHKMFQNLNAGYGWNGISVALLASNHPIGVIFTSLLWGALDAGGQYMSRTLQISNSVVEIIKGVILFLVVARFLYTRFGSKIREYILKKKLEGQ